MLQTRILGKLLRGKATPFQIASACVLGALLGAQPGFGEAPGLVVSLLALLLVLNANLFFAGLVGAATKLVSLALVAVQFEIGLFLVDGPLEGLFRALINAPVLAWFGFDNYVAVGGLVVGGVVGAVSAVAFVGLVGSFRKKMADFEEGSDRYRAWAGKGWVKFLSWVLIGGKKGKKTYRELLEKKKGLPIRIPGVIVAALLIGAVVAIPFVLSDRVVTDVVRTQLAQANGATVDLASASVDMGAGSATLTGLAVADRGNLDRNLIEADSVVADFDTSDLLRKRVTIAQAVLSEVRRDTMRPTRGVLIGRPAKPEPTPPSTDEHEGGLEKYLRQAEEWKERLGRVKEWLDEQGARDPDAPVDPDAAPGRVPRGETLEERLRRRARELGYTKVTAQHLVEGYPRALIRELRVEGVSSAGDSWVLDVAGTNLSTDPALVPEPAGLEVTSRAGDVAVRVELPAGGTGAAQVVARLTGLSGDAVAGLLETTGEPPFSGGTVDIDFDAAVLGGVIDAPLYATLRNATVLIPGSGPTQVAELRVPIRLSGPIDNPKVRLDPGDFADALAKAGKAEAARRIEEEAGKAVDKALERVDDETKDKVRGALDSILGGRKEKP